MLVAPIDDLDTDQLSAVADAFHNPPNELFGPVRRWALTLVLCGERPACRLITTRELASARGPAELRGRPEEFARGDFLGQLLRECGLSYYVRFPSRVTTDSPQLHSVYYVARNSARFELLPDPYQTPPEERVESWMGRPRALGKFLGYPADAIDAYEANQCSRNGEWAEPIPDAKLERLVAPHINELYDGSTYHSVPLEYREIVDAVLAYTPPHPEFGTSLGHFRRALRYLEAGVDAERYGLRSLKDLLAYLGQRQ